MAQQAYAEICKEGSSNNWTIVRAGNGLEQHATGFGWATFVDKMCEGESEILFGAFRAMADDGLGQPRSKIVVVNWIGARCPPKKRGSILTAKQDVANLFTSVACTVDCNDRDGLDIKAVAKSILMKTAAHKPVFYEFGDQQVQVAEL